MKETSTNEWIWLDGNVTPLAEARIGVEDRGFQFADGVYEVIRIYDRVPFTLVEHLQRLERSAAGISLKLPLPLEELAGHITSLVARSELADGMIYVQLTRGQSPRNHVFPVNVNPTLLFYTRALPPPSLPGEGKLQSLITLPDERWKRCWIKSIALLPNVLAKNQAIASGADEALFVEDGFVSECAASNLFAVIDGRAVTTPIGPKVLPGITRLTLTKLAHSAGVKIVERPLQLDEVRSADELFITSTTRELDWVGSLDSQPVGAAENRGRCGPVTRRLHEAFGAFVRQQTTRSA